MANGNSFFSWCRRHFSLPAIAVIAFIIYLLFFNSNSCSRLHELKQQELELQTEINTVQDTISHYRELNRRLETDPATLERIGREEYRMQMPDEDVFIVE